jgi:peptidoglycan/xylan/chitin deacetylase (PgdA/CDA1 family)
LPDNIRVNKLLQVFCAVCILTACSVPATINPTTTQTTRPSNTSTSTVIPTETATLTLTITPNPTLTPTTTSTPSLTPTLAPLELFSTRLLRQGVLPQPYLDDYCSYLSMRWAAGNSQPGTVVVPIMFHTIAQDGRQLSDPKRDITVAQFDSFIQYAKSLGFETITTQELLSFLTNNVVIPTRSMMIIIDDRRPGTIRDQIMPVLQENDWSVTSAYIAAPNELAWAWDLMDQLFATGRLDVQSHGYSGQLYIQPETPVDKIRSEIWDSTPVLEQHFGSRPIAFIWPGGNFTPLSVQIARQGGYQLGFTAYSRGPLMFNWVPLGEEEQVVDDPLMVLPRAWSSAANVNLDEAVKISAKAQAFAEQNFNIEAEWYGTYCGGEISQP